MALGLKISDKKNVHRQGIKAFTKKRKEMRSGIERGQFSYNGHIPECRSDKNQRRVKDRRRKSRI